MKTILIVEDDLSIRLGLEDLLNMEGYKVLSAENGLKALQTYALNPQIDLIMLDLSMPVMTGHAFLNEFERRYGPSKTPIIVMSAGSGDQFPRNHPPERKIKKPVDIEVLLSVVEQTLSAKV